MSDGPRRLGRRDLFGALLGAKPRAGHWIRVHRPAMACRFEVTLPPEDAHRVDAARAALDEVDAIEAALTVVRETSEVSRVNREAGEGPVAVSSSLFLLLGLCRELHAATGGAFDPTSTPLSRSRTGMERVELDPAARSVRFAAPGVELNFGAIDKGWALDRIAASLRIRGAFRALLTAGGSSHRGWGGEAWELALRPGGEELGRLRLRDAALGTSAAGEQHFEAGGRRYGHVLDPRTGWPAEGVRSVSVVAAEAAVADALATAFLVAGRSLAGPYCASHPGTLALLVLEARPREIVVLGRREGVEVEPGPGVRLVEDAG